jgi:hypothetical protein
MDLEELKRAGICFDFCPNAVVPEIPRVDDVLFALRLTDKQKYFDFCVANHRTYIVNLGLVIAAVGYAIFNTEHYNETESRKVIARAILELCPEEAKCFFRSAYVEAKRIVGEKVPSRGASRDDLIAACTCPRCQATKMRGQLPGRCSACGGELDDEGWCANYCMNECMNED